MASTYRLRKRNVTFHSYFAWRGGYGHSEDFYEVIYEIEGEVVGFISIIKSSSFVSLEQNIKKLSFA